MSPRRIVVLREDKKQECFVRYFLERHGRGRHSVTPLISPSGRGSGEQFVREKFPDTLKVHRRKRNHLRDLLLVVVTDADRAETSVRIQQLQDECGRAGLTFDPRNEERVAILTPRRHIETWIEFLDGKAVDEGTDYRGARRTPESECRPQAVRLADACKKQEALPGTTPPSLQQACEEFRTRFAQWL